MASFLLSRENSSTAGGNILAQQYTSSRGEFFKKEEDPGYMSVSVTETE